MKELSNVISAIDDFVWGPVMLVLLVGTGIYLTFRTRFLTWRNLGYALKSTLSKEARTKSRGEGDVSPFSALTTALAATIGTGNIVGVATAMVSGGPGALVWMWISAAFGLTSKFSECMLALVLLFHYTLVGLTSKFSECMLAIKYREVNEKGEMSGGPMYTMKKGIKNKKLGAVLAWLFAFFAVVASFGIGNMTQGNSISGALKATFNVPTWLSGIIITVLALLIIVGGIKSISKVSSVVVPVMAIFYVICGLIVIIGNISNLPAGLAMIFKMAFSVKAVGGGMCGTIVASMMNAMRYGVARGVFSNEAGMGSAAITAAAATTDNPVRQGYINMTGTFWDTIVVCTITGLAIASSGVLGMTDAGGDYLTGSDITIAAFKTVLGTGGVWLVTIGITLFAFSTILGWEYHGEKAFEYLLGTHRFNMIYRVIFSLVAYIGCTQTLSLVWNFSDIANALMAIPNLICMLLLSGEIASDIKKFQPEIKGNR